MNTNDLTSALEHFNKHASDHLNDLKGLVRIPSVSYPIIPLFRQK